MKKRLLLSTLLISTTLLGTACNKTEQPKAENKKPETEQVEKTAEEKATEIVEDLKEDQKKEEVEIASVEDLIKNKLATEDDIKFLRDHKLSDRNILEYYESINGTEVTPEDKKTLENYLDQVHGIDLESIDTDVITDNGKKFGLVIFSRVSCPHCREYGGSEDFKYLLGKEKFKVSGVNTRSDAYNDEARRLYPVEGVPSIYIFNKDGTVWTPTEEQVTKLKAAEIPVETQTNGEGAVYTVIMGGLTKTQADLLEKTIEE